MKKRIPFFLCMLISMALLNIIAAIERTKTPETTIQQPRKFKSISFNSDVRISGIIGSHEINFTVNEHWILEENSYVNLLLTKSDSVDYKNSSVTIYLNNTPIKSIMLENKTGYKEKVRVALPKDRIHPGSNSLELRVFHKIFMDKCESYINPANWIVFHKESTIHLEYREKLDPIQLSDYPYPYLKIGDPRPVDCILAIPTDFSSEEASAAMQIAAGLGRAAPYDDLNVTAGFLERLEADGSDKNLIVVCMADKLPQTLSQALADVDYNRLGDSVLVLEMESPFNNTKRLLLVTAQNKEGFETAAGALNSSFINKIGTKAVYIQVGESFGEDGKRGPWSDGRSNISFEELGYPHKQLTGIFHQEAEYSFAIPKERQLESGAHIDLNIRYSELLDFEKSYAAVYINGMPAGDKRLNPQLSKRDRMIVAIPEELRKSNYFEVKVIFYLHPKDFECDAAIEGEAWAFVSNTSKVNLPFRKSVQNSLELLPAPFVEQERVNTTFILPQAADENQIALAAAISAFLGRSSRGRVSIEVIKSSEGNRIFPNNNLILLNPPGAMNNPVLEERNTTNLNENWIQLQEARKALIEGISFQRYALLEVYQSPWNKEKAVLSISGSPEYERLVRPYFSRINLSWRLKGVLALIDEHGGMDSLIMPKTGEEETTGDGKAGEDSYRGLMPTREAAAFLLLLAGIAMIGIAAVLVRYFKKHK